MAPQLSGLFSHHALSRADIPLFNRARSANTAKESPPSKRGTSMMSVLIVQLAWAASKPPNPITSGLSSERPMIVLKS
jgi:hypothetical protein